MVIAKFIWQIQKCQNKFVWFRMSDSVYTYSSNLRIAQQNFWTPDNWMDINKVEKQLREAWGALYESIIDTEM